MAGVDDLGFELLPADDGDFVAADDELNAAAASALADPAAAPVVAEDPPEPFGYSWAFDFETGRFTRRAGQPVRVYGFEALKQRCLMALYTARFAHPIFSEEFGIDEPDGPLGMAGDEAAVAADDWRVHAMEALLALDRVAAVDMTVAYDPVDGVIYVRGLTITTDEEVELPFDDLRMMLPFDDATGES